MAKNVDPNYGRPARPQPVGVTKTASRTSARAIIEDFLRQYGLQSLASWAWSRYLALGGGDSAVQVIQAELPDQKAFQARFPAYKTLASEGRAMSIDEMLAYEKQAIGIMRAAGIPSGFYDQPQDLAKFMAADVSVNELQQRVSAASQAAFQAPQETKDALERLYGVGPGALTAFFLDEKKALPMLQQQFTAGQIAGAASRTGFGQLDQGQAERLATLGVTADTAQQGFGQLAGEQGALRAQANEAQITPQDQIDAVFGGDQVAQQRIKKRIAGRQNTFQGGAGFGAGNSGVTGLGGRP